MKYTAWYTIENMIGVDFEADNDIEAERIAEEMAENGTVCDNIVWAMEELTFNLDQITND